MTYEELFDAYRQVVSQRDQLREAGDFMLFELLARRVENERLSHSAWYPKW